MGTISFRQAFLHTVRVKGVWQLAVTEMFYSGFIAGIVGFLPLYLRNSGWTNITSDASLAVMSVASLIAVVPMTMISDRIGLRKPIVYIAFLLMIVATGLLSIFGVLVIWIFVVLTGVFREASVSNIITMNMENKGIGPLYAGTALGIWMSFSGLGGFFSPLIGNRLASISPTYGFVFWGALIAAATIIFIFTKETGWKKREDRLPLTLLENQEK